MEIKNSPTVVGRKHWKLIIEARKALTALENEDIGTKYTQLALEELDDYISA